MHPEWNWASPSSKPGMQFGHGRGEPMGMWYPRIPYTWMNNLNSSSSDVVNSRSVACMQLLFGHSSVSGVTQLMQSGGKRWSNRAHASPVHLHLGYLAVCLPFIADGSLERSNCFVLFLGHLKCWGDEASGHGGLAKEELGLRASLRSITPSFVLRLKQAHALIYLLNKSLQLLGMLVDSNRPSHKWHSLHGILSEAGLHFLFFLNNLRVLHHRKCKLSGNFTVLDFATFPEQAAAKQIIPSSHICDFVLPVLTWIGLWCLCMYWLLDAGGDKDIGKVSKSRRIPIETRSCWLTSLTCKEGSQQ